MRAAQWRVGPLSLDARRGGVVQASLDRLMIVRKRVWVKCASGILRTRAGWTDHLGESAIALTKVGNNGTIG